MQEIKYKEITVPAADGRPLFLSYFVLKDRSQVPVRYGVKVAESGGEEAQAADLTTDVERVYALAEQLARCAVTSVTLADIVADWL